MARCFFVKYIVLIHGIPVNSTEPKEEKCRSTEDKDTLGRGKRGV